MEGREREREEREGREREKKGKGAPESKVVHGKKSRTALKRPTGGGQSGDEGSNVYSCSL